jgi:hypothetical protein
LVLEARCDREYTGWLSADLHHAVVRDEVTLLAIGYMISRIPANRQSRTVRRLYAATP